MEKEKNTKRRNVFLYSLIIFLFSVSIILFLFSIFLKSSVVLEKKELPLWLTIGNRTAFNVSKDSSDLNLGIISEGNSVSRNDVLIKNNYGFPIVLELDVNGDIKDFLLFEKTIPLAVDEEKQVGVATIVIGNEPYGDYSGKLIITFKKDLTKS